MKKLMATSEASINSARDALGVGPVPLAPYRSVSFFEAERENVFGRAWLLLGRVEELPQPGSFIVRDVDICETSVLVTRDKAGEIRAFHNVCPHRASQLVWEPAGTTSVFVCPYHSWSFETDGRLRAVTDRAMFVGLDEGRCGLTPINLEIWDGWIFINLQPEPEISLKEFLGPFADYFEGIDYINPERPITVETRLACNWKVVMDAFAEAYHIPTLHRATLKPMFSNQENAFGRPLSTHFFGLHAVNSMFGNPEYMPLAKQALEIIAYNPAHVSPEYVQQLQSFRSHPAVNPNKAEAWSMDVNYLFPNTHIDTNPGGFFVHQFWPISLNETRHVARFYLRRPANIRERFAQEHSIAHIVDIVLEDVSNVERTQRGINSRATQGMPISESEVLIRHSLNRIMAWAEGAPLQEAVETRS